MLDTGQLQDQHKVRRTRKDLARVLTIKRERALAAGILAVFLRGDDEAANRNARWLALIATTATFLVSLFILAQFDPADTGFQFVEEREWLMGLTYKMGVDGISVLFVMLTTFIMPIAVLDSIHIISEFFERYQATKDRRKTILDVMDALFMPMLYTSLTSAAGFASLALTPIPPVQVFGIFVALGINNVIVTGILTVLFMGITLLVAAWIVPSSV